MKTKVLSLALLIFLSSCQLLYREVAYYQADITDYKIFPYTEVNTGDKPYHFLEANNLIFDTLKITYGKDSCKLLNEILEPSSTHAFVVIRNDSVLFEKYYEDFQRDDISTFFSVSKSVTSLLIGIAIDDGYIHDVNDPITKYIPELKGRAPEYESLTIQHLLDMRSGMKYNESYGNPFADMAKLYYGRNQLGQLKRMEFEHEPGTVHDYQSASTALLGIAIEKATRKELGKYLEEKVWIPMGMENRATWSLDDKRHRSAKAYCGLSATAIDLAKIGRLYLNNGNWNGRQIVSKEWVKVAAIPKIENEGYRNQWWSIDGNGVDSLGNRYFTDSIAAVANMSEVYKDKYQHFKVWKDTKAPEASKPWRITVYTDCYFALGIMKQVLYIDPNKNLVMVRLGATGDSEYFNLMYTIDKSL
ncbi:serine hydrolase domain-containing protein [Carboxylicivirga litoralis]|uniref:serine hydrolase domain-containing protein n=1 Tax=Carboxylicivirga litoralis TaxID=2816963 RepID=UPI0021CB95C7|nr:serine hydrolase [Carboxylicivirga sp. A043]